MRGRVYKVKNFGTIHSSGTENFKMIKKVETPGTVRRTSLPSDRVLESSS